MPNSTFRLPQTEHRQVRPDNVRSAPVRPLIFDTLTREDLIGGTEIGRSSTATRTSSATVLSKVKNNRNLVGCDTSKSNFCKWEKKLKLVNLTSREYDIDEEVPEYV